MTIKETILHSQDNGWCTPALKAMQPQLVQLDESIDQVGGDEVTELRQMLYKGVFTILEGDFATGDKIIHDVSKRVNKLAERNT